MKQWIRTTHNFNNETREWEYRDDLGHYDCSKTKSILGVHALHSAYWMILSHIVLANIEYQQQYVDEAYSGVDRVFSHKEMEPLVLHDLELMEKLGWVKSREV